MPLANGEKFGPYEILAPIGAGGMGEVYRAHDTKLKRDVALKVLPEAFASDPERMARFQREAEVLASLNHPNIAQIYGVEDRALIIELVEGENPKGPMPVDTALNYARQIADALEVAHGKGIVHRDLKPANIMITVSGVVKVLDFGLAAVTQGSAAGPNPANSPTLTMGATQAGMILGTAAYMSPEQARGKAVDKRADIWAFGVLLYEMVTGQQLFQGEDVSHTLASVIMKEPELGRVHPKLRPLLERCLEKDPKKRLRDIGDFDLLLAAAPPLAETAPPRSPAKNTWVSWGIAAFLGVAAAVVGFALWRATRPVSRSLMHLSVDLGEDAVAGQRITAVLSPDGTRIVFPIAPRGGAPRLATRPLDQPNAIPITGSEGGSNPFFSPDGRWIGFVAGNKLKKVAAEGGAPITLCDAPTMAGASWGEDGNIVFSSAPMGLWRVSDLGGNAQALTRVSDSKDSAHVFPQILPGGGAVLFGSVPGGGPSLEEADIDVLQLKTGRKKVLLHGGYFARYLPTSNGSGHLVYVHEGTLFGVAFDPDRLEVRGTPTPLLEDIAANPLNGRGGQFAFSQTGTFVYLSGKAATTSYPIVWLDSTGKTTPLIAQPGMYDAPRFSPDGERLAYLANSGKGEDVFVYDLATGTSTQLTFTAPGSYELAWSPDGKHLVFGAGSNGDFALWWIRADRSGEPQKLLDGKTGMRPQSFSPDGKRLAYIQNSGGRPDIWILPLDLVDADHPKPGKPQAYLTSPLVEVDAAYSPDGRWMAYSSDEASTTDEIYVRPSAAGAGGKWRISTKGGKFPVWSRDGRLFFLGGDDKIMVMDYSAKGDAFTPGLARVWSEKQIQRRNTRQNFDLALDGKRVAAIPRPDAEENAGTLHVTFLLNFFDEVRRRAPWQSN